MEKKQVDFIILGGGISGLGFAKRVTDNGKTVLILEKEEAIGGLSRSLYHDGFYLDFCAHRFHTKNESLLAEIKSLPGLQLIKHRKRTRIYMFNKYLKYPFEIQNLLRAMPLSQSIPAGFSFIYNILRKKLQPLKNPRSYKEWFVDIYGLKLYEVMCSPYTTKIWHHDPSEISADWANQRFQGENITKLMKRIFTKLVRFDFSSYNLEDESLAPDGGEFYYPERGIQELPDALANAVIHNNGEIEVSTIITSINTSKQEVTFTNKSGTHVINYKQLISTIPLHEYYRLQERKSVNVEEDLQKLLYMDIIFVYVFLHKPTISKDHWLYFPDKDILFNRATEFSNWSPKMCPPGKTSICFDITTFSNSPEASMTDAALIERTIEDACRVDYFQKDWVENAIVVRISHAYPYYDVEYKGRLNSVVSFLETETEYLLGRTGIFRYNNSDNSIEMGFELAEKLLSRTAHEKVSAHTYTVREVSL